MLIRKDLEVYGNTMEPALNIENVIIDFPADNNNSILL